MKHCHSCTECLGIFSDFVKILRPNAYENVSFVSRQTLSDISSYMKQLTMFLFSSLKLLWVPLSGRESSLMSGAWILKLVKRVTWVAVLLLPAPFSWAVKWRWLQFPCTVPRQTADVGRLCHYSCLHSYPHHFWSGCFTGRWSCRQAILHTDVYGI